MTGNNANCHGRVVEHNGGLKFTVELGPPFEGKLLRCYLSGKMRVRKINLYVGDMVDVYTPDYKTGRIVFRGKPA